MTTTIAKIIQTDQTNVRHVISIQIGMVSGRKKCGFVTHAPAFCEQRNNTIDDARDQGNGAVLILQLMGETALKVLIINIEIGQIDAVSFHQLFSVNPDGRLLA